MKLLRATLISFLAIVMPLSRAQEVHSTSGSFDFYVLNLSWAPEFCHNVEVLPDNARTATKRADAAAECSTPHGFVLHGLWPQNFDGTYPANCSDRPGPADYSRYLEMTPSLKLLQHEWAKHGTCTKLSPDVFFTTASRAFHSVAIPPSIEHSNHVVQMTPGGILAQFYRANPGYTQDSILLSCGRNYLTAIEVCLDKQTLKPVACQGLRSCRAQNVKIAPER